LGASDNDILDCDMYAKSFPRVVLPSLFIFFVCLFSSTKVAQAFVAPGMTTEGTLTNGTWFGFNPQSGDINGDGKQDMVIGNPQCCSGKGEIFVYFGNGFGFSSAPDLTITGNTTSSALFAGGDFGNALSVGDLNEDGFDDIVIGDGKNSEAAASTGKIYVYYGSASLSGTKTTSQADLSALGNSTDRKLFGMSIKVFDVNNDGKKDIIVAAATNAYATSSKRYTFLNTSNTFDFANPNYVLTTTETSTSGSFPYWAIYSGDFNGDGNVDFISSSMYTSTSGKLFLFEGIGTGTFVQTTVFNPETTADALGRSVSFSRADINSDGKDDFCAGAHSNDTVATNQGRVYCFFGKSAFDSSYSITAADIILNGQASNDNFWRTTFLYDVTNDGILLLLELVTSRKRLYTRNSRLLMQTRIS